MTRAESLEEDPVSQAVLSVRDEFEEEVPICVPKGSGTVES